MATQLVNEKAVTLDSLFNKQQTGKTLVDKESMKLPAVGIEARYKGGRPMSIQYGASQVTEHVINGSGYGDAKEKDSGDSVPEKIYAKREIDLFKRWMKSTGQLDTVEGRKPNRSDLKNEIRKRLRSFLAGKKT